LESFVSKYFSIASFSLFADTIATAVFPGSVFETNLSKITQVFGLTKIASVKDSLVSSLDSSLFSVASLISASSGVGRSADSTSSFKASGRASSKLALKESIFFLINSLI
jgi:hypothetical protein